VVVAALKGTAGRAVLLSVERAGVGFLVSALLGVLLGTAMATIPLLRRALGPIVTGLQSLPSIAWVPAAIIWFQLSNAAIFTVVLLGAVPSIVNGLLAGVDQVPPLYQRVGRVLGASGWTRIRYVLLPGALPGFLGGLKQGWAFAWRSLMAAELITSSPQLGTGLGQLLNLGRETSDMALVVASILLIFAVGIAIEVLVFTPVERRVLHARGLTGNTGH
jgi:NitT/TauT family transport system permease protein